jgi:hypothetical protein
MCAPWNAYQASDGWLLLCAANDEQWRLAERITLRLYVGLRCAFVMRALTLTQ